MEGLVSVRSPTFLNRILKISKCWPRACRTTGIPRRLYCQLSLRGGVKFAIFAVGCGGCFSSRNLLNDFRALEELVAIVLLPLDLRVRVEAAAAYDASGPAYSKDKRRTRSALVQAGESDSLDMRR